MYLKRTRQCEKCPWRKSTNPLDIPDGYSLDRHLSLISTIQKESEIISSLNTGDLKAMSCHEHSSEERVYCIGWLINQLNQGNNVLLRFKVRKFKNIGDVTVCGEQWYSFQEMIEYAKQCQQRSEF